MWLGYIICPLGSVNQLIGLCNACTWWERILQNTEESKVQLCIVRKGGNMIIALQNTLLADGSKTIFAVSFSYIYRKNDRNGGIWQSGISKSLAVCPAPCVHHMMHVVIMWNSISGLDTWYHLRFNISCGVAVMGRSRQQKFQVTF